MTIAKERAQANRLELQDIFTAKGVDVTLTLGPDRLLIKSPKTADLMAVSTNHPYQLPELRQVHGHDLLHERRSLCLAQVLASQTEAIRRTRGACDQLYADSLHEPHLLTLPVSKLGVPRYITCKGECGA